MESSDVFFFGLTVDPLCNLVDLESLDVFFFGLTVDPLRNLVDLWRV